MSQSLPSSTTSPPARGGNVDLQDRVRSLQLSRIPGGASYGRTIVAIFFGAGVLGLCAWLGYLAWREGTPGTADANEKAGAKSMAESGRDSPSADANAAPPSGAERDTIALESKGYIVPVHQILVSPEVSGRIVELSFEEGTRVEAGFILARIDDVDYQADYDRAQATAALARARLDELKNPFREEEIQQAKAELDEAQAQRKQWVADYRRAVELRKSGSLTDAEFDEIETRLETSLRKIERLSFAHALMQKAAHPARIAMAEAEFRQAQADLVKAEVRLGKTQVKAPVKGTILKKNAEIGNVINPLAQLGTFSFCDMADLSELEVELNIQERDIASVFVGQKCQVRAEAYPSRTYEGHVSRLMPIADRAKGAIPVRVKVVIPAEEEGIYLRPEMSAIVTFLKASQNEVAATAPSSDAAAAPPAFSP